MISPENYIKDQSILKALHKKGITDLFPIQYQTFNTLYQGDDLVARDRTGSGKTLAFFLPILARIKK